MRSNAETDSTGPSSRPESCRRARWTVSVASSGDAPRTGSSFSSLATAAGAFSEGFVRLRPALGLRLVLGLRRLIGLGGGFVAARTGLALRRLLCGCRRLFHLRGGLGFLLLLVSAGSEPTPRRRRCAHFPSCGRDLCHTTVPPERL